MGPPRSEAMRRRGKRAKAAGHVDKRVVTGMANSLRTQILVILNERMASATEISRELSVPFHRANYEMSVLHRAKAIEEVQGQRVRGATERFYRAKTRAFIERAEWPAVADNVKGGLRATLLDTLGDDAMGAISDGAYDSLDDAHMSWIPMIVDEHGWHEVTEILRQAMEDVIEVQENSKRRLRSKDEAGTPCTVSMLGYPSALEKRKVGPPEGVPEKESAPPKSKGRERKLSKRRGKSGK